MQVLTYFNSRPCERGFKACSRTENTNFNFNSRPCERGFIYLRFCQPSTSRFQFTPLREGLRSSASHPSLSNFISIHAPARGASILKQQSFLRVWYFNSRPCERGFYPLNHNLMQVFVFQFTPLREGLLSAMEQM